MNRDVLDRICERAILGLVLAILVFGPLATGAVRTLEFLVLQGLTFAVLLLWVVRLWLGSKPKLLFPPLCWAVLAFAAYAIGRYFTADIEYIARQELIRVLLYAFLFLAVVNNLHRQECTTVITFTLVFVAMGVAAYAVYQYMTGSDHVWNFIKPYKHRGSGTYISPNHLGGFLEMLLPLGLTYSLVARVKPVTRILIGYASLVILAGIVVTMSRGSWLSTALALSMVFVVLIFDRRYRLPSLVLLGVMLVGAAVFMPRGTVFQHRAKQLVNRDGEARDGLRYAMWEPAFRMWQDHPWWGVGPAHFDARFGGYRPDQVQIRPDRAHNDYLNTLADWGIVGTILVASAWVLLGIGTVRTWRSVRRSTTDLGQNRGSNKMAFVLGASAGLLAILAHSVVDFNMHVPANAILAVTLMALLSTHWRFATERYWFSAGPAARVGISACLLIGAAYLAFDGSRRASEYVWLERARRAELFSAAQVQSLKKAFAADPRNPDTAYKIGEALRRQSQEGGEIYTGQQGVTYGDLAREALTWFQRGIHLNPWQAYNYLGYGWCLDWLKRQDESPAFFNRALQLEPNSFYVMNQVALHHVETGNYAAARPLFERSLHLESQDLNITARNYLALLNRRLLEGATDDLATKLRLSLEKR